MSNSHLDYTKPDMSLDPELQLPEGTKLLVATRVLKYRRRPEEANSRIGFNGKIIPDTHTVVALRFLEGYVVNASSGNPELGITTVEMSNLPKNTEFHMELGADDLALTELEDDDLALTDGE